MLEPRPGAMHKILDRVSLALVKSHVQDFEPKVKKLTRRNTYQNRSELGSSIALWNILLEELEMDVVLDEDRMRLVKIRKSLLMKNRIDVDEISKLSPSLMSRIAVEAYKVKEKKDFGVGRSFSQHEDTATCLSDGSKASSVGSDQGHDFVSRKSSHVSFAPESSLKVINSSFRSEIPESHVFAPDNLVERVEETHVMSLNAYTLLNMHALSDGSNSRV